MFPESSIAGFRHKPVCWVAWKPCCPLASQLSLREEHAGLAALHLPALHRGTKVLDVPGILAMERGKGEARLLQHGCGAEGESGITLLLTYTPRMEWRQAVPLSITSLRRCDISGCPREAVEDELVNAEDENPQVLSTRAAGCFCRVRVLTGSPHALGASSGEDRRMFGSGDAEQLASGKADSIFGNCSKIKILPVARLVMTSHPSSPKESESHGPEG